MKHAKVFITESDFSRLSSLLESAKKFLRRDREHLSALEQELNRADVVAPQELPADVVTMNSRVRVTDLDTGMQTMYTLSFPRDADIAHDRVSVLAPIGTFSRMPVRSRNRRASASWQEAAENRGGYGSGASKDCRVTGARLRLYSGRQNSPLTWEVAP